MNSKEAALAIEEIFTQREALLEGSLPLEVQLSLKKWEGVNIVLHTDEEVEEARAVLKSSFEQVLLAKSLLDSMLAN